MKTETTPSLYDPIVYRGGHHVTVCPGDGWHWVIDDQSRKPWKQVQCYKPVCPAALAKAVNKEAACSK